MARFLKQSTAFTFRIGPFVDSTDGVTAETALTIAQADIQISKAGGAFAQTSASPTTTHDADGWYQCPLTATDTGTVGTLTVQIAMAGALPVWEHFMVLPANIFDSLVGGTDVLDVSVTQWLGTAAATPSVAGVPEVDLTHVAGATTNVAALATNVDAILTDTADMQPKLGTPAGASVSADIAAVKSDTAAILVDTAEIGAAGAGLTALATAAALATVDTNVDNLVSGIIFGAAATGTLSTTQATSNLTGYADDQLIGRVIIWLTGACEGEATDITDYASASGLLTFTAVTTAPGNGDTFKIV